MGPIGDIEWFRIQISHVRVLHADTCAVQVQVKPMFALQARIRRHEDMYVHVFTGCICCW
jgi:hypothetical protein